MARRPKKLTPQTIEHVAHHEAGHFVAAYFQAIHEHIDGINIVPAGDAAGQNTGQHPLADGCSRQEIERVIIELFAGHAAEVRFDPVRESGGASVTARDDDEKADEFLGWLDTTKARRDKVERRLRLQACSLVEEHWSAVAALARELLERKRLDADEAAWVVAIAEGEHAKTALAEYRRFRDAPVGRVRYPTAAEHQELQRVIKATRRSK